MEDNFYENNWKLAKTQESQGILEKTQGILEKAQGTGGLSLTHPPKEPDLMHQAKASLGR